MKITELKFWNMIEYPGMVIDDREYVKIILDNDVDGFGIFGECSNHDGYKIGDYASGVVAILGNEELS